MYSRHPRLPGERIFMLLIVLFSAFMLWAAYGISQFDSITSPGAFPMACAALMLFTGALNLLRSIRSKPIPDEGMSPMQLLAKRVLPWRLVLLVAWIGIYMLMLEPVGFLLSSLAFLVVAMTLLGSRRIVLNLVISLLMVALIFVVFRTAFSVVLPSGTLVAPWLPGFLK